MWLKTPREGREGYESSSSHLPTLVPYTCTIVFTIGFVRETYSAIEGINDNVEICVVVSSGRLERSATVTVATADAGSGFNFATGTYKYVRILHFILCLLTPD